RGLPERRHSQRGFAPSSGGGLTDLPHLSVLFTRKELPFANGSAAQAKGYVLAAYTKVLPKVNAPTLQFEPKPYETFDESADLYRDGSVLVVALRGHTSGSVGVFVNFSPARRFFYMGDSVDDETGFEERVAKTLLLRDSDNDPVLANQIVSKLTPTPRNRAGNRDHPRACPQRLQEILRRRPAPAVAPDKLHSFQRLHVQN
ncbi:MAG TPA: hypothetical protein VNB49_14810, partial [Candidatus Dormibacteraeota bacterium]|nr:hypothetical protein [Candidatus Dormibacteraeota bacterium]